MFFIQQLNEMIKLGTLKKDEIGLLYNTEVSCPIF